MQTIAILKRRDAASVVVAIVVGLIVNNAVQGWAFRPAAWLSSEDTNGGGWNAGLWRPLVTLVIQLIVLELVVRLYTWLIDTGIKK